MRDGGELATCVGVAGVLAYRDVLARGIADVSALSGVRAHVDAAVGAPIVVTARDQKNTERERTTHGETRSTGRAARRGAVQSDLRSDGRGGGARAPESTKTCSLRYHAP